MTAVLLLTSAAASLAQPAARDAERERRIEQQLRLISPEAVPAFRAATAALDRTDFVEAARLYQRVLELAPRFSPALRRLGISLVQAGYRRRLMRMRERPVLSVSR